MKALLTNRWFLSAAALLAIALIIVFVGPLIGIGDARPFETWIGQTKIVSAIKHRTRNLQYGPIIWFNNLHFVGFEIAVT